MKYVRTPVRGGAPNPVAEETPSPSTFGKQDRLPPPPSEDVERKLHAEGPVTQRLGGYELIEEIARGGMGIVYRARQISLDRIVAVKMIRDSRLAGPDEVARFQSEAAAAARLQHPHIVAIHEVGAHQGQHFFSMDYVSGPSLADHARAHSLSPWQAALIVTQVARGVQAAHDQGILHRDLKPSNILIDEQGRPRITDFGLAKQLGDNMELTGTQQVLGTPGYMPPEQARGQHGLIGFCSDVYALGAILYELLSGRPPFRGESPAATLSQVLTNEPVSPRRLNPAVSRDLETLCLKCLEKEPAKRYPTAGELADELDRILAGQPILARPVGRLGRTARWCRRNPAPALALLLLAAVALGSPVVAAHTTGLLHRARLAEQDRIASQIVSLTSAAPEAVPAVVAELDDRRSEVAPQLAALWSEDSLSAKERTRLSVFLYAEGSPYREYAYDRLLSVGPQEFGMLRQLLKGHYRPLVAGLWKEVAGSQPTTRLRAAAALAEYDPSGEPWSQYAGRVAEDLLEENSLNAGFWAQHFEPVKEHLLPRLCEAYSDDAEDQAAQRALATDLIASYAADDLALVVELVATADARQFDVLIPLLADHGQMASKLVERKLDEALDSTKLQNGDDSAEQVSANLAIALLRLGRADRCWPLLAHGADSTLRTWLIHRLMPLGAQAEVVVRQLRSAQDVSVRRALILALGQAERSEVPAPLRDQFAEELVAMRRDDPDTGIFSAAGWLLRQWGYTDLLSSAGGETAGDAAAGRGRIVTCEGQVMAVVRGPVDVLLGSPASEQHRDGSENQVAARIPRSFAFALKEVTREEYLRFEKDPAIQAEKKGQNIWYNEGWSQSFGPDPQSPHLGMPRCGPLLPLVKREGRDPRARNLFSDLQIHWRSDDAAGGLLGPDGLQDADGC